MNTICKILSEGVVSCNEPMITSTEIGLFIICILLLLIFYAIVELKPKKHKNPEKVKAFQHKYYTKVTKRKRHGLSPLPLK